MLNLLKWPEPAHWFITVLILLCVAAQTVCLIMKHYERSRRELPLQKLERLFEFCLLCMLFAFPLMHGDMIIRRHRTLFAPVDYHAYRIGIVCILLGVALCLCFVRTRARPILSALPALVLLPAIEAASGAAYPYLFVLALLIYLFRGIYLSLVRYGKIRTSLSSLAVKHAIDTLDSGLLFCEKDGYILLINQCMQNLMTALTGKLHRNGLQFYDMLPAYSVDADWNQDANSLICQASDESVWLISKTVFTLGRKAYTQIAATNITRQWHLTAERKRQNDLLRQKSEELKKTMENLHLLSRQKETQEIRRRAHDIIGNRLSLILSSLYSKKAVPSDVLLLTIDSLIEDMKKSRTRTTAEEELSHLRETFLSIGVQIRLEGDLPDDAALGNSLAEIVHEAVTNAVRHGFATELSVCIRPAEDFICLEISDNGHGAPEGVAEGRGIAGMRDRIAGYQGRLEINPFPRFTISVTIPKGGA